MPIAKFRASSSPDAMKPEEGNDSLDTFIRQAIGKEPYLSFSRTNDSPVQWIQLLHALDQQDLPGWPLLTPLKVQMQKCDKCSREFCSPINYRRHIRVHRRSLNFDKESHKNRDLLGAFWDKISMDEAKEIVSFNDVILEEVPGSSIIKALTSFIRKPGFCALPQVYVKAGSVLLDVIQARLSRLPISSQELFSILDDASEKTFLCAGTAESMQKYVFDGEAGKIGLEMKNLVACTSFLVEQKLVKAWLADKDAEALRCQKLLVEEEEASQRRQAELLERKRQKKLRQKEQKTKEQSYEEKPESNCTADILESLPSAEPSSSLCEGDSHALEAPADNVLSLCKPVHLLNNAEAADIETQGGYSSEHLDSGSAQNAESRKSRGKGHQHLVIARWQVPKTQKRGQNGFHPSQNLQIVKPEPLQKRTPHRDTRAASVIGSKVWTRKDKVENGGECVMTRVREEEINQTEQSSREVMIGSISVTVRNCDAQRQVNSKSESQNSCSSEHIMPRKISGQDELMKPESVQSGTNRSTVKCWRPVVSTHETRGQFAVQSGNQESEDDPIPGVGGDRTVSGESCLGSCEMDRKDDESKEIMQIKGLPFSSHSARAFLAQRWKEAISGDHVTLLLSSEPECHGYHDSLNDRPVGASTTASTTNESDIEERSILGNAENRLGNMGALESSTNRHEKAKFRTKPEKGVKIKYIPKQTVT